MRILEASLKRLTQMKLDKEDTIDDNPYAHRRFALTFHLDENLFPLFSLSPSHVLATLSQHIGKMSRYYVNHCVSPRILLDLFTRVGIFCLARERGRSQEFIFFCSSRVLLQGTRCLGRDDGEEYRSSFFASGGKGGELNDSSTLLEQYIMER